MNKKQIIEAAKALSIDEITYLQMELAKLKKVKAESQKRIAFRLGLTKTLHPVCYT